MTTSPTKTSFNVMSVMVPVLKVFAALVVVLLITVPITLALYGKHLDTELESRVAAIRASGLPTNWVELAKWPAAVSAAENAAFIYTNACAHVQSNTVPSGSEFEFPTRGTPFAGELRTAVERAVATNQEALRLATQAAQFSKARYPVDYLEGPFMNLPHLDELKTLVRLLVCDALLRAETGDAGGAATSVATSISAARSLDTEPRLISQFAAASMLQTSCRSLERVLCLSPLSEDDLARLTGQLTAAEATNRFFLALVGERALIMELLRLIQDDLPGFIEFYNRHSSQEDRMDERLGVIERQWKAVGLFTRDRVFYLRAMETNLAFAKMAPPASLAATNELERLTREARRRFYFVGGMLSQFGSAPVKRDATLRAHLRATITGLAVERWRLAHGGDLPDSLERLVPIFLPTLPADPFDGRPLRFKRLPRGFVVYSVGPNQRDDGGRERPPPSQNQKASAAYRDRFDITFAVER